MSRGSLAVPLCSEQNVPVRRMPSNAQSKTSGSKNQNKPSTSKNASRPAAAKDVKQTATPDKPSDTLNQPKALGKISTATATADPPAPKAFNSNEDEASSGVVVNKKRQKRRQKDAARKAAEQSLTGGSQSAHQFANVADNAYQDIVKGMVASQTHGETNGLHYGTSDYDDPEQYEPEEDDSMYYRDGANPQYQEPYDPRRGVHAMHDYIPQDALGGKAKKKKKAKANSFLQDTYSPDNPSLSAPRSYQPPPPPPPPPSNQYTSSGLHRSTQNDPKDRIWNTSTAEERERIKEFWLSLDEEDRRSLVKVEKEAVLKKMKEQQKHSCSCTVCGRKRTAIEEELEVLYDAYYEELEVYANPNHGSCVDKILPLMNAHSMVRMPPNPHPQMHNGRSSRSRIQELGDDDEAVDEEEYSDEEDDEDISEDEYEDQTMQQVPNGGTDFFNFGRSLTVQGSPGARISSHWTQCADFSDRRDTDRCR